jgi:hypothetical protein
MNLKSLLVAACTTALAATAFAEDAHNHNKASGPAAAAPAPQPASGPMDMSKMGESMQRMQEQMKNIQAASDSMMPMMRAMSGNAGPGEAQRMQMMEECMGAMHKHQTAPESAPK